MIRLADIRDRLQSHCPALRQVQGAAEFRAITGAPPAHLTPAAWVVPVAEDPERSKAANAHRQVVAVTFAVILAVCDRADPRGQAAGDDLEAVKQAVHDALLGWSPPGASGGVDYAGGSVLEFETAAVWWMTKYSCNTILRGR